MFILKLATRFCNYILKIITCRKDYWFDKIGKNKLTFSGADIKEINFLERKIVKKLDKDLEKAIFARSYKSTVCIKSIFNDVSFVDGVNKSIL